MLKKLKRQKFVYDNFVEEEWIEIKNSLDELDCFDLFENFAG